MRFQEEYWVPHFKEHGYYCPACWTFWGATFAEVRKNRKKHDQQKYDDAVALWHLLPELREAAKEGEGQRNESPPRTPGVRP